MRSTSPDGVVVRDLPAGSAVPARQSADLRSGDWTRLGAGGSLGDEVTESLLERIAARSHAAARAQGYAVGWAEGRRVALDGAKNLAESARREADDLLARQHREHAQALQALEAATTRLNDLLADALQGLAGESVELALGVAEAILGREVATAADPGADAVRRALGQVASGIAVRIRLNPADRAVLGAELLADVHLSVVEDASVARGDAIAETEEHLVDATIAAALARVREVLAS